jgi:hypothetical protein
MDDDDPLFRCVCNGCGVHLVCEMDGSGPLGSCPSCRCAFLTPLRTKTHELECLPVGDRPTRAVKY